MNTAFVLIGSVVGLIVIWKVIGFALARTLPSETLGRAYLYKQLKRIGLSPRLVDPCIIDAAVNLAESLATNGGTLPRDDEDFCQLLEMYALAIRDGSLSRDTNESLRVTWRLLCQIADRARLSGHGADD